MSDPVAPAASEALDTFRLGRALVDTFGKGWAKGDVPLLMSVFSDDAVFVEAPFAQARKGREAILNYWRDVPVHQAEVTFTILTDRDIRSAWASPATTLSIYELTYVLQKLTVESVMVKNVITTTPDATIERAAKIMHDNKIGSLPVVEGDKVVGIISSTDLMEVLLDARRGMGRQDKAGILTATLPGRV